MQEFSFIENVIGGTRVTASTGFRIVEGEKAYNLNLADDELQSGMQTVLSLPSGHLVSIYPIILIF